MRRTDFSPTERKKLALWTPKTKSDLWNWVKNVLNIEIPRKQCCDDHESPFDAFAASYFAEDSVVIWKASRGFGGKTYLLSALALTEMITLGADIRLLGGSGEQSKRIHDYIYSESETADNAFWNAPLAPRFLKYGESKTKTKTHNGGKVVALKASATSVRGPHPERLRLDEADETPIDIIEQAQGQPMSDPDFPWLEDGIRQQTTFSSTHHNPDGTMTQLLEWAEERGWPVFEWCWRETVRPHGWLPMADVETKRNDVSSSTWELEYELQEPEPEGRIFDPDVIDRLFDVELGQFKGENGERITLEFHNGPAFHGTDWAKDQDWTIIATFELRGDTLVCVEWLRIGRRPWPEMVRKQEDRIEKYGGASFHDGTGVGEVVDDYLDADSEPWDFRKRKQTREMLSRYIGAVEDGEIKYPKIDFAYHEHKYLTNEQVYGTAHLPDSVAAGALALKAFREGADSNSIGKFYS